MQIHSNISNQLMLVGMQMFAQFLNLNLIFKGNLEFYNQLLKKKHFVIVVAEGAAVGVRDFRQIIQNQKLDIGIYKKLEQLKATLKYIDPTYMIRTVPANIYDRKMCANLSSSAVHGALAGYTDFTVGHINHQTVMIPIEKIGAPNRVQASNRA